MSFKDMVLELYKPAEPEVNFNFLVLVGAAPFGCFKSISEFAYTTPKMELVEGGRLKSQSLAFDKGKGSSWGHVTLKWGNSSLSTLQAWSQAVRLGWHFRREVFIFQLSRSWEATRIFHLHGAWPVKWTADGFDGDSGTSPWTVTGVELAFKTMNMVLPGFNLLRAAGVNVPNLGLQEAGFGDLAGLPEEDPYIELDIEELEALDASELSSIQLAALERHRIRESDINASLEYLRAKSEELDEEIQAMEGNAALMSSLDEPAGDLTDAEFAALQAYLDAKAEKAATDDKISELE